MPKGLPARCQPDCVRGFLLAAEERFRDGTALAQAGRRTAAIYLWGYVAEMVLKAAYFRLVGLQPGDCITVKDFKTAAANAPALGFKWGSNFHHVESWAQLLVLTRAATPGAAYSNLAFGNEIVAMARRVQRLWTESLRYHRNVAYLHEVDAVMAGVQWLLRNSSAL